MEFHVDLTEQLLIFTVKSVLDTCPGVCFIIIFVIIYVIFFVDQFIYYSFLGIARLNTFLHQKGHITTVQVQGLRVLVSH